VTGRLVPDFVGHWVGAVTEAREAGETDERLFAEETALAALVISIAAINVWNRLNVSTRQLAGSVQAWG
jgi:hypothetical protein